MAIPPMSANGASGGDGRSNFKVASWGPSSLLHPLPCMYFLLELFEYQVVSPHLSVACESHHDHHDHHAARLRLQDGRRKASHLGMLVKPYQLQGVPPDAWQAEGDGLRVVSNCSNWV